MAEHNEKAKKEGNSGEEANKNPDEKKRAVCMIYTRKTTLFSEGSGLNDNETQRMRCEAIINKKYGFIVSSKRYDDIGVDIEEIDKRPTLRELFADVEAGSVDIVVVSALNIISESFRIISEIMKVFRKNGICVIVAGQNIDTATASGRRAFIRIRDLADFEEPQNKLRW